MIEAVAPNGDCRFATAYEQVRGGVLEGATLGGHFGLVILLREGVAAWMAHGPAQPLMPGGTSAKHQPLLTPTVADDVRADVVAVLCNMIMTVEKCT